MTDNQQIFCDEYLIDRNATRAYKAAYPRIKKNRVAESAGNRMLRNVEVQAYIKKKLDEMSSAKTASAEEVIHHLTAVLRGQSNSEVVVVLNNDGISHPAKIQKLPDEKEKLKAAELLGKYYGLFTEKVKIDGSAKVVIVDDLDNC